MNPELEKLVASGRLTRVAAEALSDLEPGVYCKHKSWGGGRVKDWDLLGDRVAIDFEGRPGHEMKLEFAAKSVSPIEETHLLARRFSALDELKEMAGSDPAGLVRLVLESFGGEMYLDHLEDELKGSVIDDSAYKKWWDGAKRKLRQDRSFVVPSKRNEPLGLRASDLSPADSLIEDFQSASNLKEKSKALSAIIKDLGAFDDPVEQLSAVVAEVNEAGATALRVSPAEVVELVAGRDELAREVAGLGVPEDGLTLADIVKKQEGSIGEHLNKFPVSRQRMLLGAFPDAYGDDWTDKVIGLLEDAGSKSISEITKFVAENGEIEALTTHLQKGVRDRQLPSDVLAWLCREREGAGAGAFDGELVGAIMHALERDHYDENVRGTNRLRDVVMDDMDLIPDLVRPMDISHVMAFGRRLLMSPVFDELDRRSVLARVIKTHPEAQALVSDEQEQKEAGLIVSWESLERRKEELDDLIQKKIPENSKEIAVARSYGDLRENFEYKAAKQMQAVLMRRKSEMERELSMARGTDFAEADDSKVGIGTRVQLEEVETGEEMEYTILGAWDTDTEKRIVAYISELGKALVGKELGEEAAIPAAEEGAPPRVVTIKGIVKHAADAGASA
ncbi:MAG: GreA/GreB family elongation factor [Verrucomicrobiota bacterium]